MSRDDEYDQLDSVDREDVRGRDSVEAKDSVEGCDEESFDSLLEQARAGSEVALSNLVRRFSPSLYRSIRRSLMKSMRRNADSDDIAQSVWRSFFANREKHLHIDSPGQMRLFLAQMAVHKAIDRGRQQKALQTEEPQESEIGENEEEGLVGTTINRRVPSPSEEMIAREALEALTNSVPERFAAVIRKRAEGASIVEISEELGIPLRTLHRILQNIRVRKS
ncbi:MAG TPA: sigma-70 family RNA polymerase sigma factor [Planctomicrobium sp.]|nr:sigma-70 family RNA polymerase sigma factor [Planctomicrobium sp.]